MFRLILSLMMGVAVLAAVFRQAQAVEYGHWEGFSFLWQRLGRES